MVWVFVRSFPTPTVLCFFIREFLSGLPRFGCHRWWKTWCRWCECRWRWGSRCHPWASGGSCRCLAWRPFLAPPRSCWGRNECWRFLVTMSKTNWLTRKSGRVTAKRCFRCITLDRKFKFDFLLAMGIYLTFCGSRQINWPWTRDDSGTTTTTTHLMSDWLDRETKRTF